MTDDEEPIGVPDQPEHFIVNFCYGCNHLFPSTTPALETCPWCEGNTFKMHRCQAIQIQVGTVHGLPGEEIIFQQE